MKIYYGVDRKAFAKVVEYPMISFRTMEKRKTPIITNGKEWFMDSGAFTYLRNSGKFPFTYGEYLRVVDKFQPSLFANMDWCCEPDIVKATGLSVLHHIAHTVDNGRQLIDFDKKRFVMVLQGWTIEDYMTCIDYVREQGLFTELIGVGSVCIRKNPKEVFKLLKSVRAVIPDWCNIHCFGLSIDMLQYKEIYDRLESVDTYAWCREFGLCNYGNSDNESKIKVLKEYQNKVKNIIEKNEKQSYLKLIIKGKKL